MKKLFVLILSLVCISQYANAKVNAAQLDSQSRAALSQLIKTNGGANIVNSKASGVLVFPSLIKMGMLVGGSSGKGALFVKGATKGYYRMDAASIGIQAGAQEFGYAIFFMNNKVLSSIGNADGWDIGSAPSLVVADDAFSSKLSTTSLDKEIYVFFFNQQGLMGGLGVEGSKITRIHP